MEEFFFLDTDNDGHWYVIPKDKEDFWNNFLLLEGEDSWKIPDFAKRVNGPHRIYFATWYEE